MKVVVVGRGRVGSLLARELSRAGLAVRLIASRGRLAIGKADVVIVAVRDPAIEATSERLAPQLEKGTVVLHCAGNVGPLALHACAERGVSTGVMHPLVSIADKKKTPVVSGTTFVIDGDARARAVARRLVKSMRALSVVGSFHGAAYHAAAVLLVGGSLANLVDCVELLRNVGLSKRDAVLALGGLLRGVGENVMTLGIPAALTGPIVRGDVATISAHLRALESAPVSKAAYIAVAQRMLRVAQSGGLDAKSVRAIGAKLRQRPSKK